MQDCLEKYLKNTQRHLKVLDFFPFTGGFNSVFGDLNQYKIMVPLFGAAYAKAPQFYTYYLKLISLEMDSSISEVEFKHVNQYFFFKFSVLENSRKVFEKSLKSP